MKTQFFKLASRLNLVILLHLLLKSSEVLILFLKLGLENKLNSVFHLYNLNHLLKGVHYYLLAGWSKQNSSFSTTQKRMQLQKIKLPKEILWMLSGLYPSPSSHPLCFQFQLQYELQMIFFICRVVSVAPLAVDVKGARMLSAEKMVGFQSGSSNWLSI